MHMEKEEINCVYVLFVYLYITLTVLSFLCPCGETLVNQTNSASNGGVILTFARELGKSISLNVSFITVYDYTL